MGDTIALITGATALLVALTKLIMVYFDNVGRFNSHIHNINNHIFFNSIREWRHNLVNLQQPSTKKEHAICLLITTILETLEHQSKAVQSRLYRKSKNRIDFITWHMDNIDLMYQNCLSAGLPLNFIKKYRKWVYEDEAMILEAIKICDDSSRLSEAHRYEDVLNAYYILWGHIFNDIQGLKNNFLETLNGEAESVLEQFTYINE